MKPLAILNIFGGNIGGPIKKDKLFYFFNFERTTERTGYFGAYSVAPADFRAGDFSKWTSLSIVYDPAIGAARTTTRRARRSRTTSSRQNRINPIFPNIYKDMPMPNQIFGDRSVEPQRQLRRGAVLKLNRNQYDTKVNYNVTHKLTTWGKYSRMDAPVEGKYPFGDLGGSALGTAGKGETTTQIVTGGYNYTIVADLHLRRRLRLHAHGSVRGHSERR